MAPSGKSTSPSNIGKNIQVAAGAKQAAQPSQALKKQHQTQPSSSSKHASPKPQSGKVAAGANQAAQPSQALKKQHQTQPSSSSKHASPKPHSGKEAITGTKKQPLVLPNHIHPHPLTLMEPGEPYKCSGCKELGFGSSYRCESNKCSYVLHEACARAARAKSPVRHPFFGDNDFKFLEKPLGRTRLCDACRKEVTGFVYHREDNGRPDDTGLDVHPCCLELKDSISYKDGNVSRTLELRRTIPQKCLKCKSMKVKDDVKVRGWAYESSDKKYCFHVSCFKELIIDKWKEGCFSEKRMSMLKYDPKTQLPLTDKKIGKDGGSSKGSKIIKAVGEMASVIIPLFTAIFGNPVSIVSVVLVVVESLPAVFKLITS